MDFILIERRMCLERRVWIEHLVTCHALSCRISYFLIPVFLTHLVYLWIRLWISKPTAPCITELKSFNDTVIRQHWRIHVITEWWRQIISWNVKYLTSKNFNVLESILRYKAKVFSSILNLVPRIWFFALSFKETLGYHCFNVLVASHLIKQGSRLVISYIYFLNFVDDLFQILMTETKIRKQKF